MSGIPKPTPAVARDFLHWGFDGVEGYISLFAAHPRMKELIDFCSTDDLSMVWIPEADLDDFVADLGADMDLYYGVATRQRPLWNLRGRGEDCLWLSSSSLTSMSKIRPATRPRSGIRPAAPPPWL